MKLAHSHEHAHLHARAIINITVLLTNGEIHSWRSFRFIHEKNFARGEDLWFSVEHLIHATYMLLLVSKTRIPASSEDVS